MTGAPRGCRWIFFVRSLVMRRVPGLSERDRAALALVDAVACGGGSADSGAAVALASVRRHFSERGVAELTACLADHHLIADDHQR